MAFRVFLDASVLLDFTLKREGRGAARRLMEWAVNGRVQAYVTPAVMQETGRRLKEVYGAGRAKELLLAILAEVQVIDTGHAIAVSALLSTMSDVDDALAYYTALHHKLDYFITRNNELSLAATPVLPVCTPEAFLEHNGPEANWPKARH
ncbi:PIN domain-containing protein [Puia sp.]|jgi:predicted nucleic acid-binding protein|uniref:PIN domain-containing protein n=1 Tax=Puia sp. TaxID=2045100 RepID=UPI002F3EC132